MPDLDQPQSRPFLSAAITLGFATAVAMWAAGFVTHMPGLRAPASMVGVLLLVVQVAGAALAGRGRLPAIAWKYGLAAGIVTGLINMLIIGSVLAGATEDGESGLASNAPLFAAGYLLFSAAVGAVAATAGASLSRRREEKTAQHWLGRFGVVTAIAALPVLLSGGLVTSTEAGLAVPDWPNTFQTNMFMYPLSKMTGGIYYEHAHRLFGSLVGLSSLTLLIMTLRIDRRIIARIFAAAAFAMVLAQGILGGLRVTSANLADGVARSSDADTTGSLTLAFLHGVSGQLTFALICATAAILSVRWINAPDEKRPDGVLRASALVLLVVFILQLSLGAAARHFQNPGLLHPHILVAFIVLITAIFAGARAKGHHRDEPALRIPGTALMHAVILQIILGFLVWWLVLPYDSPEPESALEVVAATTHQAVGALLLGASTLLAAWTLRLVGEGRPPALAPEGTDA